MGISWCYSLFWPFKLLLHSNQYLCTSIHPISNLYWICLCEIFSWIFRSYTIHSSKQDLVVRYTVMLHLLLKYYRPMKKDWKSHAKNGLLPPWYIAVLSKNSHSFVPVETRSLRLPYQFGLVWFSAKKITFPSRIICDFVHMLVQGMILMMRIAPKLPLTVFWKLICNP